MDTAVAEDLMEAVVFTEGIMEGSIIIITEVFTQGFMGMQNTGGGIIGVDTVAVFTVPMYTFRFGCRAIGCMTTTVTPFNG